jgi:hypothetical protein
MAAGSGVRATWSYDSVIHALRRPEDTKED